MAITFEKRWDEGPLQLGSKGNATVRYVATSDAPATDTREIVIDQMVQTLPAQIDFPVNGTNITLFADDYSVAKRIADGQDAGAGIVGEAIWDCAITYKDAQSKPKKPLPVPITERPIRWTYRSASEATKKKKISEFSVQEYAYPDYRFYNTEIQRYMGFERNTKGDSPSPWEPEGVAVPLTGVEIGIETVALDSEVDAGYFVFLAEQASKNVVNSDIWYLYPIGSLKFTGFDAKQREDDNTDPANNEEPWDINITLRYSAAITVDTEGVEGGPWTRMEENKTDGIKLGHEYLDTTWTFKSVEVNNNKFTVPKCIRMAIQEVFDKASFASIFSFPYTP